MYELTTVKAVRGFDAATSGQSCTQEMAFRFAEMFEWMEIQLYLASVEHRFGGEA